MSELQLASAPVDETTRALATVKAIQDGHLAVRETLLGFTARHGGQNDMVMVKEFIGMSGGAPRLFGRFVFKDGAMVDSDDLQRWEPSTDRYKRLIIQRLFFQERSRRARNLFLDAQQKLYDLAMNAAKYVNLPGPPQDAKAQLRGLRQNARMRQAEYLQIEREILATPESKRVQAIEAESKERSEKCVLLANQIAGMGINANDTMNDRVRAETNQALKLMGMPSMESMETATLKAEHDRLVQIAEDQKLAAEVERLHKETGESWPKPEPVEQV